MPREYRLMSADGHLEVPPERWIHRVPEKYRDRAPHTVKLPDGGDALMIEGQPLLEANFLDLRAGRAEGTWTPFGLKVADAAGTGGPEQRVRSEEHTSELQSHLNLVCRLLLEKKKNRARRKPRRARKTTGSKPTRT